MNLEKLAAIVGGELIGADVSFSGFSIDSRSLKPENLFIALEGENFNGHHFITAAQQKGAIAALVSEEITDDIPHILVKDTLVALSQWAAHHRQQFNIPVIGITGSMGKTTTKTLLASILSEAGNVLATEGTLNNHIGVPLTLLRITKAHHFAVIEMGANHIGEIAHLVNIAKPTHALITGVAPVHLEGFGSIDKIAATKTEIFNQLPQTGTAIINADDNYAEYMRSKINNAHCISFGVTQQANIMARDIHANAAGEVSFVLTTAQGEQEIKMTLIGKHNAINALAAAAVAYLLEIPLVAIKAGLEKAKPANKRLNIYHPIEGITIIDDSYNASPIATKAALEILSQQQGEKIFVFGDMLELGPDAEKYHQEIGQEAARLGINQLYAYGKLTKATVESFGVHGYYFTQHNDLIAQLRKHMKAPLTILVKGSNSMQMCKIVEAFCR